MGGLLKLGVGGVGDDNGCENLGDLLLVVIEDEVRVSDFLGDIHLLAEVDHLGNGGIIRQETSRESGKTNRFGRGEFWVMILENVEEEGLSPFEIRVANWEGRKGLKEFCIRRRGKLADNLEVLD